MEAGEEDEADEEEPRWSEGSKDLRDFCFGAVSGGWVDIMTMLGRRSRMSGDKLGRRCEGADKESQNEKRIGATGWMRGSRARQSVSGRQRIKRGAWWCWRATKGRRERGI